MVSSGDDGLVHLAAGPLALTLSPRVGGSIARFDYSTDKARVPILRDGAREGEDDVLAMGSFPLVPFVNRIRGGEFRFRDRVVRLAPNMPGDPSPLHGQGWLGSWSVVEAGERTASLRFDHPSGEWPWDYSAEQRFELGENGLNLNLTCTNRSAEPMPCGLGQHPYFKCGPNTRIQTAVSHVWLIDDHVLPTEKVPAEGRFDLSDALVCGMGLDHGFGGWGGTARLSDPDWPFELSIRSGAVDFFQLYSPAGGGIFVAEPVTHANAAMNAPEDEWAELGLQILEPRGDRDLGDAAGRIAGLIDTHCLSAGSVAVGACCYKVRAQGEGRVASLELIGISKSFGSTPVLEDVSLALESREFIAFLGPSGSGKSTLLRIIAGLETADSGEVWLEGQRIDRLPPGKRDVAMVFQHYALYPHMTVRENMAFGLRNARVAADEIHRRVEDAAAVLEIQDHLDKKPAQMSGGQRQRVAIGRAIVKMPKLFLLDEPLSNLDAALRMRTRVELAQLKQRVDAAVIMVTHDQAEAMTLADRIVVMNDRRILQVGPPMEIYSRPANVFVAQFVGSPAMTLAPAALVEGSGEYARLRLGDGSQIETRVPRAKLANKGELRAGLRSEAVRVATGEKSPITGTVELVERLGERSLIYARLSDGLAITAEDGGFTRVRVGDQVGLQVDGSAAYVFDAEGIGYHGTQA